MFRTLLCSMLLASAGTPALFAQAAHEKPAWLGAPPRVTVTASADRTATGWTVHVDVVPLPGIHVYTPGNPDYIGVRATLTVPAKLEAGEPVYPKGEPYVFGELKQVVEVYQRSFRVDIPVRAGGPERAKDRSATGVLHYQACTDKVCFPPQDQTFTVELPSASKSK